MTHPHPWRVVLYGRVVTVRARSRPCTRTVAKAPPLTREQFDLLGGAAASRKPDCSQGNLRRLVTADGASRLTSRKAALARTVTLSTIRTPAKSES